jgi:hypothetical protein
MPRARMLNLPRFRARDVRRATAWTWAIHYGPEDWQFVRWAVPTKAELLTTEKPSPEARPVMVTLVATSGLYRMPHANGTPGNG